MAGAAISLTRPRRRDYGISASRPRRRRDSSSRNVRVAAAASPRLVPAASARRPRPRQAGRTNGLTVCAMAYSRKTGQPTVEACGGRGASLHGQTLPRSFEPTRTRGLEKPKVMARAEAPGFKKAKLTKSTATRWPFGGEAANAPPQRLRDRIHAARAARPPRRQRCKGCRTQNATATAAPDDRRAKKNRRRCRRARRRRR